MHKYRIPSKSMQVASRNILWVHNIALSRFNCLSFMTSTKIRISVVSRYIRSKLSRKFFNTASPYAISVVYWIACHWDLYPSVVLSDARDLVGILSSLWHTYFFYFNFPAVFSGKMWMPSSNTWHSFQCSYIIMRFVTIFVYCQFQQIYANMSYKKIRSTNYTYTQLYNRRIIAIKRVF